MTRHSIEGSQDFAIEVPMSLWRDEDIPLHKAALLQHVALVMARTADWVGYVVGAVSISDDGAVMRLEVVIEIMVRQ